MTGNTKPFSLFGHYKPGDRSISSSDLNTLIEAVKSLSNMTVEAPLACSVFNGSLHLYLQDNSDDQFFAKIKGQGPEAESDYEDYRYWFNRVRCDTNSGDEHSVVSFTELESTDLDYEYSTVVNLSEIENEEHSVPVDTIIRVFVFYDAQSPPQKRFFFVGANTGVHDGPSETFTVVEDVFLDGLQLKITTREITVTEGVVTGIGTQQTSTVFTGTEC
jgi:hypothetical protein